MGAETLCARDVMRTEVRTVTPTTSLSELERLLVDEGISGAPVVNDGELQGVVSRSDILRQLVEQREVARELAGFYEDARSEWESEDVETLVSSELDSMRVGEVMTTDLITVEPSLPLKDLAQLMTKHRIHRVLVTEGQSLRGLISTTDVVATIADGRVS